MSSKPQNKQNLNSPNRLGLSLRKTPVKPVRFSLNLNRVPRIPIEREDDSSLSAQRTASSIKAQLSGSSNRKSSRRSSSRSRYMLSITSRSDSSGRSNSSRDRNPLPAGLVGIPWDPKKAVNSFLGPDSPPSRDSLLTCPPGMPPRIWKRITVNRDVDSVHYDPRHMPPLPPVDHQGNEFIEYDHWREFVMYYYTNTLSRLAHNFFLSSDVVASSKPVLLSSRITHILNTAGTACLNHFQDDFVYRRWLLNDEPRENIASIFYEVVDFVETTLSVDPHSRFLVHCSQGVSRSTTSCICYLCWKHNEPASFIFDRIKKVRRVAEPNAGFNAQVTLWANIRLVVHEAKVLVDMGKDPFSVAHIIDGSESIQGFDLPIITQISEPSTHHSPSPHSSSLHSLVSPSPSSSMPGFSSEKFGNLSNVANSISNSLISQSPPLIRSRSNSEVDEYIPGTSPLHSGSFILSSSPAASSSPIAQSLFNSTESSSSSSPTTPMNTTKDGTVPQFPLGSAFEEPRVPENKNPLESSPVSVNSASQHSYHTHSSNSSSDRSTTQSINRLSDYLEHLLPRDYDPVKNSRLVKDYLPTALFRVCPRNLRDCEHIAPRPCRPDEFKTLDPRYVYLMQTIVRPAPATFPQHFLFLWIGSEADSRLIAPAKLGCSYLVKYEAAPTPIIVKQGEEPFAFWAGLGWEPKQMKDPSQIYPHVPDYIEHTVVGHKIDLKSWEETLQSVQKRRPSRFDRINLNKRNLHRRTSFSKPFLPPLSPTPEQEKLLVSSGLVKAGSFSSRSASSSRNSPHYSPSRQLIDPTLDNTANKHDITIIDSHPVLDPEEVEEEYIIETDEIGLYDCEADGFHKEAIPDTDHLYVESVMATAVYPLGEIYIWIGKQTTIANFVQIFNTSIQSSDDPEEKETLDSSSFTWETLVPIIADQFWKLHKPDFEHHANLSSSSEDESESEEDSASEDESESEEDSASDDEEEDSTENSSKPNTLKKLPILGDNPESYSLFLEFQGTESKEFLYYMN